MDIALVRDSLRGLLAQQIPTATTQTHWYEVWPNKLQAPCGIVERVAGPTRETYGLGGLYSARLQVVLLAGPSSQLERSRDKLDPFVATSGVRSLRRALEADRTLGGQVRAMEVGEPEDDEAIPANGIDWVGTRVPIDVWGT